MARVVRRTRRYVWVEFNGKQVKTTKGSTLLNVLRALEVLLRGRDPKAFRSTEISSLTGLPVPRVSYALKELYRKGALQRTGKRLVFGDSPNMEYVYGLTREDVVRYVLQRVQGERKDLWRAYEAVKEEGMVSSHELREICDPGSFRYWFVESLGVVGEVSTAYVSYFYDPERLDRERARTLAYRRSKELISSLNSESVKKGLTFEEHVLSFFEEATFVWRLERIERHRAYRVGEKRRVFDLVLHFVPEINGVPVKYLPRLVVPVEVKDTATGEAVLLEVLTTAEELWGHAYVPLVVTSEPRRSAFEAASRFRVGLLTSSDLKRLGSGDSHGSRESGKGVGKSGKEPGTPPPEGDGGTEGHRGEDVHGDRRGDTEGDCQTRWGCHGKAGD